MRVEPRVFPASFKRETVDRIANGGLGVGAMTRELGLHDPKGCASPPPSL